MGVEIQKSQDVVAAQFNFYTSKPEVHDLMQVDTRNLLQGNYQERRILSATIVPEIGQDTYDILPFDIDEAQVTMSGIYNAKTRMLALCAVSAGGQEYRSRQYSVNNTNLHFANVRKHVEVPRNVFPAFHHDSGWYADMHTKRVVTRGIPGRSMLSRTPYARPDVKKQSTGYLPKEVRVAGGYVLRPRTS